MVHQVGGEPIKIGRLFFNIILKDRWVAAKKGTSDDGLYNIFDSGVNGGDLPGVLGEANGVYPFKAADLQKMFIRQIKKLMHQYDPSVGNRLGFPPLSLPCRIAKSPAVTIYRKTLPLQ